MASDTSNTSRAAHGKAPREWEQELETALDLRDHERLQRALNALRSELGSQNRLLDLMDRDPVLDRLIEQSRRIFRSAPTEEEALETELSEERQLWADYRQRYREHFIPTALHPFLKSSGIFISPSITGIQCEGFEKYTGHSRGAFREAITLFYHFTTDHAAGDTATIPANVFTSFNERNGRFVIQRVYKTDLPRNAGRDCVWEHVSLLIPKIADLRVLVFDNVQNRETYDAHVITERDGIPRLREKVGLDHSPLGRFGLRILTSLGLKAASVRPVIDGFGFLDLYLTIDTGTGG